MLEDTISGVLGRDVELQGRAADLVGHLGELFAGRRDVHRDDASAVAVQRPGDGGADPARGPGHHGDLTAQRSRPVLRQHAIDRIHTEELPGDECRTPGEQETQGTSNTWRARLKIFTQDDPVRRPTGTHLVRQRARQAGHSRAPCSLGGVLGLLRVAQHGDHSGGRLQLLQQPTCGQSRLCEIGRRGHSVEAGDHRSDFLSCAHLAPHVNAPAHQLGGEVVAGS